tara:strand:- start:896 stop:1372 length:477 start_codon:yes stop_codon:yes gene_type:complete
MKIQENFLNENIFKNLQKIIMSDDFPWYYQNKVVDVNDDFFFSHILYMDDRQKSDLFYLCHPIIGKINFTKILRVKLNCYTRKENHIKHGWHTDQVNTPNAKVALFSFNTNNGYTLFKNNDKVVSKENTIIFFDNDQEHASVSQTDKFLRINMNINYV